MHKETINTFTKGMIKDTHPLTTPADVLTDCLNGTIITYNGNEMILLNDMGNVLVGTAALPEGYIPIGITEYGGIIYVASYNPATGKGQIGSFPSPQLQHMSEMWSVNISEQTPTTNTLELGTTFYANGNSEDIIRTEYKYYLGRNGESKDVYTLHTGDKIQIINEGLVNLQNLSCIELLFAILKKDGSIELVEGNYIDGNVHIYTGKSSGYPLIIIKMLTLKSFNLERKYSRGEKVNDLDTVTITFTGKPQKEDQNTTVTLLTKTTTDDELPGTYTENPLTFLVENLLMDGSLKYQIVPRLNPQGNLISMTKEGVIDLSKFKSDKAELKNWSYVIMDTYMKINWSFDYYNLDDDNEIRKVTFKFITIDLPGSQGVSIDLEKDSFNGSFEEIINFEEGITKNNIYVVKIIGYKGINNIDTDNPIHLGSRMVYTSGILNLYYGKVKDFTNAGFRSEYPSAMWDYNNIGNEVLAHEMALKKTIEVKITPTIKVTKVTEGNNVYIINPINETINTNIQSLNSRTFTTKTNDVGNGLYVIDVTNNYEFEIQLKADVKYDNQIVGKVADATISRMLSSFEGNKLNFTDESQLIGNIRVDNKFTPSLEAYDEASIYELGETYNTGTLKFANDLELTSKMKIKATDLKSKVIERKGLKPLYYPSMDRAIKDKCFTAWNKDNPLFCAGADENNYHYNVTLAGGSTSGGTNTGAGCDDTGLNTAMTLMGNPMVSMAAGIDGDEASYSPDEMSANAAANPNNLTPTYYIRRTVAGWGCSSNEIDGGDNFLMTVWKQTDNNYRFSLLGSLKSYSNNRSGRLVRLDYMLRCLLSQIFTKLVYKETLNYVTTNANEYGYYNTQVKANINLESDPTVNYNNVTYNGGLTTNYDILLGDYTIEKLLLYFRTETNAIKNNEVMIIKYDYLKTISEVNTTFATDFGIDDISSMFSGAAYEDLEEDDKSNERWIYTVDWTAVDAYGRNKVYEFLSDNSINWKLDDLTSFLKLSGTKDGSGYAFIDDDGSYKIKKSDGDILPLNDPLSLTTDSPSNIRINVVTNYNNSDPSKGGLTFTVQSYGDVLRTWNNKEWPFYHSFQHVFKTYCLWKDTDISSEIFNEIVINRDSGHIGELNTRARWRNNKDADAPDMVNALGNSYNSIYAVTNPNAPALTFLPLENANYTT